MKKDRQTFYHCTKAVFIGCKPPKREPDYTSVSRYHSNEGQVSSMYWYTAEGVYRASNHWSDASEKAGVKTCGDIAGCWWAIKTSSKAKIICGFCPWWKFKNRH